MTRRGFAIASVLATAGAATLLACGTGQTISADVAEKALRDGLGEKGLDVDNVKCPANEPATPGLTFSCTVMTKSHDAVQIDVSVLDTSGTVKWDIRGVVVHEKLMGEGITSQSGDAIQVKCPDKVTVIEIGSSFECEAGSGGQMGHIRITVVDKIGNVTWKLLP